MEQLQTRRLSRHMLIMILCCLIPVAALAAIYVFKVPVSQTLTLGLILLCPLSHVLLMGTMGGHKHDHEAGGSHVLADTSDGSAGVARGKRPAIEAASIGYG